MTETPFRRDVLKDVDFQPDFHAGLWLDKYLEGDGDDAKKNLVNEVIGIKTPDSYKRFFDRWKEFLVEICGVENCREAETRGRLAVNLGAEAVLETSIALHHTYGVPYIPGSAFKGLAAHYVKTYFKEDPAWWENKGESFRILFGDTTSAGYVTFYDALMLPGKGKLVPDVITVHHPKYYQGEKDAPPADWDSPTPIPFITATGTFLVALSSDYPEWVKAAFEILELALEREGIGAKTSSGYGRMAFINKDEIKPAAPQQSHLPLELPPGYQRGVVKKFIDAYGFIQPDVPGPDIFVHISNLAPGVNTLQPKQRVIYKPGPGKKPGQIQANDVRPEG